jgi:hypothetical protein
LQEVRVSSTTVATRLSGDLLKEVQRYARRGRLGPSEALRRIVDEWVAISRYPALEFRDGPVGRRPGLRGGPDVWEIMALVRDIGADVAGLREHLGSHVSVASLEQALAYAAEHRAEIESWIEENDSLGEELERQFAARARG